MTEEDEDRILNEGEPVLNDSDSEDEVMGKEKPGENSSKKKVRKKKLFLYFFI